MGHLLKKGFLDILLGYTLIGLGIFIFYFGCSFKFHLALMEAVDKNIERKLC